MRKINTVFLLIIIIFLCGCATKPNTGSGEKSVATKMQETLAGLKQTGSKIISRSGDKNPVIKDLISPYKPNQYAVGAEKDVMNYRAQSYGLLDSMELNQYLSTIRQKLQKASNVTGVPGGVYVDANMEMNASASADGNLFIYWGVLRNLSSEDEVAGIVAHELAHVLLGHHDSNAIIDYNRKIQFLHEKSVSVIATGRKISNSQTGNITIKDLKSSEIGQLEKLHLLVKLSADIISPTWQRTQEREADLLAVDLLIAAGYNPDGLLNMLSVLKQNEKNTAKEQDYMALLDDGYNVATTQDNVSKINSSVSLLQSFLGKNHTDNQTRIDDVSLYLQKHYAEANTTGPYQIESWKAITKSPKLKKIVIAYDGAYAAEKLIEQGKSIEALRLSTSTLGNAKNHSYPIYIQSLALEKNNKTKNIEAMLKTSTEQKEASGIVYQQLMSKYEEKGQYKQALAFSQKGYAKFGNSPVFLPRLVRYNRLTGNMDGAHTIANDCSLNHTFYKDRCVEELTQK